MRTEDVETFGDSEVVVEICGLGRLQSTPSVKCTNLKVSLTKAVIAGEGVPRGKGPSLAGPGQAGK